MKYYTLRIKYTFIIAFAFFLLCDKIHGQEIKNNRPNFILIMADDLGYGDIECFGNARIKTPNLDRMATEGIRFRDFHSNGAVCSPTRAALLTGRYQQRSGISGVITANAHRDVGLPLEEVTLAEALKKAGYTTGMFGKWHLGYDEKFNPVHQGFDEYIGYVSGNVDYHSHVDQAGFADWWTSGKPVPEKGYSTDLITNHAVDFINRHQREPFFLYIAHEAPHYPYQDRDSKADRFPGGKINVDFPGHGSEENPEEVYKNMIEIMDEDIGNILTALKQDGIYENTMVIFCSDNGALETGSNGVLRGYKGSVWEGGHRVPAIVQYPGKYAGGKTIDETVLTMDFFPTILNAAGIQQNLPLDGVNLNQFLAGNQLLEPRTLFWQHGKGFAVRKGEWKLVLQNDKAKPELYNLQSDIGEKVNVATENPELVNQLVAALKEWRIITAPKVDFFNTIK